ncbi:MAG: M15 family metallopeptidase [Treponemataceae bacterium]|nr:M15 family metallopeptidase [Treponemataceae bacterium]
MMIQKRWVFVVGSGIFLCIFLIGLGAIPAYQRLFGPREVLKAYERTFPDRVSEVSWKEGDWTITVAGITLYWAQGRILPHEERSQWHKYLPYVFYTYPETPPDARKYTPERIEQLRILADKERRENGLDHHPLFRSLLYEGRSRGEIEAQILAIQFLGKKVSVHRRISAALGRIDKKVRALARTNQEVATFLSTLGTIGGYNWREIRGTQRMSFHSWGLAIDIQPQRLGGKVLYWGWEQERNPDWMLVPQSQRWAPPTEVIQLFEQEGFIWGGKWDLYDQMHFEYRPELLLLKKLSLEAFQSPGEEPPRKED